MKQTVNKYDFHRAFETMGRAKQFSYDGRDALFQYLEQYEEDTGTEIELDVIALCCDYSEDTVENIIKEYSLDSLDDLRDQTNVIEVDTSDEDENKHVVIYQAF